MGACGVNNSKIFSIFSPPRIAQYVGVIHPLRIGQYVGGESPPRIDQYVGGKTIFNENLWFW